MGISKQPPKPFPIKEGLPCQLKWTHSTVYHTEGVSASSHRVNGDPLEMRKGELNIHKLHHPSSSFLKLSKIGTKEGSEFTKVDLSVQKKIRTPIVTLDNYFKNFNLKNKKILLKSDTQGFEVEVLKGAKNLLKVINTVIVEGDFTANFYEKQANPIDTFTHLKSFNF